MYVRLTIGCSSGHPPPLAHPAPGAFELFIGRFYIFGQVNGCRQRFLTKFLQVRLVEVKKNVEGRLDKIDREVIEIEASPQRDYF